MSDFKVVSLLNPTKIGVLALSAGTTQATANTVKFADSNGISFGLSGSVLTGTVGTNYAGINSAITGGSLTVNTSGISINVAGLTTAALSGDTSKYVQNWKLTGNTAGTTSSAQGTDIWFAGGQGLTISGNSNSLTFSVGSYITTADLSQNSSNYAGINSAITGGSLTVNTSGVSINLPNYLTTADLSANSSTYFQKWSLLGNTAGTTTTQSLSILQMSGGQGITLSGNSNTIVFSVGSYITTACQSVCTSVFAKTGFTTGTTTGMWTATHNTAGLSEVMPFLTRFIWPPSELTALNTFGNATVSIQYVPVYCNITGSRLDALVSLSAGSAATSNTAGIAFSQYAVIYTRNASSLSSVSSGSTQTTYTYASNTAGQTQLISAAIRPISVPVNFNMQPGEYFVAFNIITNTTSIGANTTAPGLTISMMGGNALQSAANYAEITVATATSMNLQSGMGIYSAASTGIGAALSLSGINQTGSALSQANIALVFRNA